MIWTLLKVRFRSIFAGMTAQNAKRKKPTSPGMILLYVVLILYLIAAVGSTMVFLFDTLAPIYNLLQLDWLYFSMAGLMALGLSVIGSVFTTQAQLYDAKDNDLLLSMPIPPRMVLLSRMIPLLTTNLLFAGIVMIPAIVVYAIQVQFTVTGLLLQLLAYLCICLLSQAIASIFGWLLHLLMRKLSPSLASLLYTAVFLGLYFTIYGNAQSILAAMTTSGQQLASTVQSWIWPLFAMGNSCLGDWRFALAFFGICASAFTLVYLLLSATFLRTATSSRRSKKAKKLDHYGADSITPMKAIRRKEMRKFLGTPVYLTNMGIGLLLTLALPIAGIFIKDSILPLTQALGADLLPLMICGVLTFTLSTCSISVPSVSLEGKNLWVLQSLPISGADILRGKLQFHLLLTLPVSIVSGLATGIVFGCSLPQILLCGLLPGLVATFNGLVGMWSGLRWAKFDYINEAYPCKQSIAVLFPMFGTMGIGVAFGFAYRSLWGMLPVTALLGLTALILGAACFGLYRLMITWGVKKWESLQA